MRLFVSGDLHIWNDSRLFYVKRLCDRIIEYQPDVLVLSEIGDPWKAPWTGIIKTESWKCLQRIVAGPLPHDVAPYYKLPSWKTYDVLGNHDRNTKPEYLPGATLCHKYEVDNILIMHGWEFDGYWNIIHPFAFWISRHRPQWMVPIYNLIFRHKTPAQKFKAPKINYYRDDWSMAVETIHARERAYAQKHNKILICGHDHCPTPFDGLIADWGDGEDSFSYITVDTSADPVTIDLQYL